MDFLACLLYLDVWWGERRVVWCSRDEKEGRGERSGGGRLDETSD